MEGEKEELEFDVSVPDNSTLEGCFSPTYYRRRVLVIKVAWCFDTLLFHNKRSGNEKTVYKSRTFRNDREGGGEGIKYRPRNGNASRRWKKIFPRRVSPRLIATVLLKYTSHT